MIPSPADLAPLDIPEVIHARRVHDTYDVRLVPMCSRVRPDGPSSSFTAEVRWTSPRTGKPLSFSVEYMINPQRGQIYVDRTYSTDLVFTPYPRDEATFKEFHFAWENAGVEDLVQGLKLELGRYCLLVHCEQWRRAFTADVPRRQELIEDMWDFADEAMTALVEQFPEEEHTFPMPIPEPVAGFGFR